MREILVLNTGGTFNKRYDPIKGELEVPTDSKAIESITKHFHNSKITIKNIIHKDSLEFNDKDREILSNEIKHSKTPYILIIHGTDTMDLSAKYIDGKIKEKIVVFTGAMVPLSIDSTEAVSNFSMSFGFLLTCKEKGIYIGMHGIVKEYKKIYKNRKLGIFEMREDNS